MSPDLGPLFYDKEVIVGPPPPAKLPDLGTVTIRGEKHPIVYKDRDGLIISYNNYGDEKDKGYVTVSRESPYIEEITEPEPKNIPKD